MGELGGTLNLAVIKTMPAAALPSLIVELAALQAAAAARMAAEAARPVLPPVPDRLLPVAAAAALIGWSPSAMRKRGHLLPGFTRTSPGRVRWSEQALRAWVDRGCPVGAA